MQSQVPSYKLNVLLGSEIHDKQNEELLHVKQGDKQEEHNGTPLSK